MVNHHLGWSDQHLDRIVGNLLRAGVLIAAFIVSLGAILYLTQEGLAQADFKQFTGQPPALENVGQIAANAAKMDGKAVIQLGLLVLIATPVARVVLLLGAFALQRDRLYVIITLFVLAVLLASMAGW